MKPHSGSRLFVHRHHSSTFVTIKGYEPLLELIVDRMRPTPRCRYHHHHHRHSLYIRPVVSGAIEPRGQAKSFAVVALIEVSNDNRPKYGRTTSRQTKTSNEQTWSKRKRERTNEPWDSGLGRFGGFRKNSARQLAPTRSHSGGRFHNRVRRQRLHDATA